ncbi:MAG: branched-chain amino acid ABC transporter permease [Candidatus Peregrinibacteria bacterium]|nr:branched-chain amino acid ABC transporter permease [Candidatus Peregrinibacteria bacterium]
MDYILHIATFAMIYLLLVQSMNLYLGYTGILALSHIAFFGIGAYAGALISLSGGSFWLGLLVGGFVAGILGLLLGLTSIKLSADYLGIATLGFAQITSSVMQNWTNLTRGPLGLPGIPRPTILGIDLSGKLEYLIFVTLITTILMFVMYKIMKSPFGQILETIRDDEIAAKSMGKNTTAYKLIAFTIGAIIAALAGSLLAHFIKYIDPMSFHINQLALVLVMTILGGLGTFRGPFIGVAVILFISEGVTFLDIPAQYVGSLQMIIYSLVFLTVVIYFPQGIAGFWKYKKRRRKQFTSY